MRAPTVSVIIPTFDGLEDLLGTLAALFEQSMPAERYETVVVVDGSTDGTCERLASLTTPVHLVSHFQSRRGRGAAINAGARLARGQFLVFLDDDITATPTLLEEHATYLHRHPGHAVVGAAPIQLTTESPAVVRLVGAKMNGHLAKIAAPEFQFQPRDFYSGNFAIDRSLFLATGGFDEDFTLYGNEDCEFARRLMMRGVPIVYNPRAVGHQRYTKTFSQLVRDTYEKGRTRVLFGRKHPDIARSLGVHEPPRLTRKAKLFATLVRAVPARRPRHTPPLLRLIAAFDRVSPRFARHYRAILDVYFWLGVRDEHGRAA